MNSNQKGEIACKKLDIAALEAGVISSIPIYDARYDRIIDWNGKLYKVQVKYCSRKTSGSECYRVDLVTYYGDKISSTTYTKSEIDALVVYLPDTGKLYWIPIEIFEGKQAVGLRIDPPKNNQKKGVMLAKDFELDFGRNA